MFRQQNVILLFFFFKEINIKSFNMDLCFTLAWPSCICFLYLRSNAYSSVSYCKSDLKRKTKVEGRSGKSFSHSLSLGVLWTECWYDGCIFRTPMNFWVLQCVLILQHIRLKIAGPIQILNVYFILTYTRESFVAIWWLEWSNFLQRVLLTKQNIRRDTHFTHS